MKRLFFASLLLACEILLAVEPFSIPQGLGSGNTVVPADESYLFSDLQKSNTQIIYTRPNLPFAQIAANEQQELHEDYEKYYGWRLDEKLYIGLLSGCNQIPNAFSTQWPNNRQMNYMGGSVMVDYFSATSWLKLLLHHESAHNYQLNAKASTFSQDAHTIIGNGTLLTPLLMLTVPNIMENSFLLEGNAVLNESWHGNGGRLYNGALKAQTLIAAQADRITPQNLYNVSLEFPYYGFNWYIIGGHYNYYLAQKYGLEKINSYFLNHSEDFWWPHFTNWSMINSIGVDFESSLAEFAESKKAQAAKMRLAEGEKIAASKIFYQLGSSSERIYFLTQPSGVSFPELAVYDKKTNRFTLQRTSHPGGKVIEKGGDLYTQATNFTSPAKITQGLYNSHAKLLETSDSKVVQGYLKSGEALYFDVKSSFDQPQLYMGDEFYAQVNSSVYIDDEDNLYYFVQGENKERTLYKNKTAIAALKGFYGHVVGADKGVVYLVANSENGSSLYGFQEGRFFRASSADNIIDARIIDESKVLIAAIEADGYAYRVTALERIDQAPYEERLFFEQESYYGAYEGVHEPLEKKEHYTALGNLHYSGADLLYTSMQNGDFVSASANFGDPLGQNSAAIFIQKDDANISTMGTLYENSEHLLSYRLGLYGLIDKNKRGDVRSFGAIGSALLPLYRAGYESVNLFASFYQDYQTAEREPLSLQLGWNHTEQFGYSLYPNFSHAASLQGAFERGDAIFGGSYAIMHDLPYETYLGAAAKGSATPLNMTFRDAIINSRGVKLSNYPISVDMDPTLIDLPALGYSDYYVKSAAYIEANAAKVLNFSSYWFTFPFSLQRESIYLKARHYHIREFDDLSHTLNEARLGLSLNLVMLNKLTFPLTVEALHVDKTNRFILEQDHIRLTIGGAF